MSAKRIGIAVVERQEHFVVGVRPPGVPLEGMAEFPGGKCEPDEPPRACVVRECLEETGLAVEPLRQLATVLWSYPHGDVELHFWLCGCVEAVHAIDPPPLHPPFRWLPRAALQHQNFPPANSEVLAQLVCHVAVPPLRLTVQFYAAAREAVGVDCCEVLVPPRATMERLRQLLYLRFPNLSKFSDSLLWAVDNQFAAPNLELTEASEIACFPPVSGG
jgi:mutator protein MutT